ncbi:MAG: DNA recombination protein RmuC [Thermoanaerobaculia bacterium]|nr:DNA recombination protein RmuC [Thermoanaerobaculia bacterium]
MEPIILVVGLVALIAGALAGWLVASTRSQAALGEATGELRRLEAELEAARRERERTEGELTGLRVRLEDAQKATAGADARLEEAQKNVEELRKFVDASREQLKGAYAELSRDALSSAIEQLGEVVKPQLEGAQTAIGTTLDERGKAIETLLAPVREMIESYRKQMEESESHRNKALGGIGEQLKNLLDANNQTRQETAKLASALRNPAVSGSWGENTLRNCVEQAGMSDYCDFTTQETVTSEEGRKLRPDMQVKLPGGRVIAVDSKAPLESYLEAAAEQDETRRNQLLADHAGKIRRHVDALSRKEYQASVGPSLDFTILFVGGEQFLSAALVKDPTLFEYAATRKIYLASPMVLLPMLRAVAAGWRADKAEQSAMESLEVGLELCKRFVKFFDYFGAVGKSLEGSVKSFNEAVQSASSRLIPQVSKLQGMVGAEKQIDDVKPIERLVEAAPVDDPRLAALRDEAPTK